ncbi:MAG: PspA/IM30 family protein [Synechococcales cyanobacterium RM1_1_8]|nr:PspA/IM30 family protein [Synechococcales cyanobacterium RM1_1_8]
MGLLDRVGRIVRAQVTHWASQEFGQGIGQGIGQRLSQPASQAEDPARILEQTVQQMQQDVLELRQAVAQAVATLKRTERQRFQAETQAADWQRRAFMAGEEGQVALAREALAQRQTYINTAEAYASQLPQQRQLIAQLKQNLRLLDAQFSEAKTKKDLYIARARSAAATHRMNELLERTTSGPGTVFERVEDKILQLEALAELAAERRADPLGDRFSQLEAEAQLQQDELQLRQRLALPRLQKPPQNRPSPHNCAPRPTNPPLSSPQLPPWP